MLPPRLLQARSRISQCFRMFPTRLMLWGLGVFLLFALTPLMFKAPDRDHIQIENARWSAVAIAKLNDRIFDQKIDGENELTPTVSAPPAFAEDRASQSQIDVMGSPYLISIVRRRSTTSASVDRDQSLGIEFPVAAYEPPKPRAAIKQSSRVRTKVTPNRQRSVSSNQEINAWANDNFYKHLELPQPNFTTSAY